ncbi:hypothetical protein PC119_g7700 [Phytophthora cactorum]|nr:hypothetical protein PC119_g7700 [Phytophthora cactorum]
MIHVKREFNQAADYLTTRTLAAVNRIPEKLVRETDLSDVEQLSGSATQQVLQAIVDEYPDSECAPLPVGARILAAVTRSKARAETQQVREEMPNAPPMTPLEYQTERRRRIKTHQDGDLWVVQLKALLRGDLSELS